jgi:hypothetical protein
MQVLAAAYQRLRTAMPVDAVFQRQVRAAKSFHQLRADDRKRAGGSLQRAVLGKLRPYA